MNSVCIRVPHNVYIVAWVCDIPKNVQVTPLSPIFNVLLSVILRIMPRPTSIILMLTLGHFPCNDRIILMSSRHLSPLLIPPVMSQFQDLIAHFYLIFNDTFALFIIARPFHQILDNPTSARWSLCGVAFPVYYNSSFNFQSLIFTVFLSMLFSSTLSHLPNFIGWPFCFHFLNHLHVG